MLRALDVLQTPLSLQLPERVRHAHIRKRQVVPARRTGIVPIERTQVGVQPIRTPRPRLHRQVRRRHAEPLLGVRRAHGHGHRLADLVRREKQIVLDLCFRQSEILQARIPHRRRRVAVQTVVHEQLRPPLQRCQIVDAIGRRVERRPLFSQGRRRETTQERQDKQQFSHLDIPSRRLSVLNAQRRSRAPAPA